VVLGAGAGALVSSVGSSLEKVTRALAEGSSVIEASEVLRMKEPSASRA
jgi:hypothetical protein